MAKSRFNEVQKIAAVQMIKAGKPIIDVCCEYRISSATYYSWRRKLVNKTLPSASSSPGNSDSKQDKVVGLCVLSKNKPAGPAP